MKKIVGELQSAINGEVDEIGVTFVEDESDSLVVQDGKIGIPNKLVPRLHEYLRQNGADDDQTWFSLLVCSG